MGTETNQTTAIPVSSMTPEQMVQHIARLEAALALKPKQAPPKPSVKLGKKPGVFCIYGLQRYPFSFRPSQFKRLVELVPTIQQFIADNNLVAAEATSREDADTEQAEPVAEQAAAAVASTGA